MKARLSLLAFLLLLTAPASAGTAVSEPPRLSFAITLGVYDASGLPHFQVVGAGLCLAGANGSEGTRLTAPRPAADPAWSPNGRRLAFAGQGGILLQDEHGRSRLIASPGNNNGNPDWSPDGRQIVFDAGAYGSQIYLVRPDGSGLRQLTGSDEWGVFAESPDWSPDGSTIVFSERSAGGDVDLFFMDPDGGNRRLLTENGLQPSWSPDGSSVVFVRGSDLMIVGADGRDERILTATPELEQNPAWSPDGRWIAFERSLASSSNFTDIAVIRPDGSGLRVVRGSALMESDPAWRPRATRRPGKQRACVIRGNRRANVLRGTSLGDILLAGPGRDLVFAGGGDDLVDGGGGADLLAGGSGHDVLNGGWGADRLAGGPGNDLFYSEDRARDIVMGNAGRDAAEVDSLDLVLSVESVETYWPASSLGLCGWPCGPARS